jgi:TfoX/Sxy family transcriptional regulator of competence genes
MVYNEQLASKTRAILSRRKGFGEKKMFGGIAYLINGNMCCGVLKDDLVVRVGPEKYEEVIAMPGARPMDFTGRQIKGFVYVDSKGWSKSAALKKWVEMGVNYASLLPKKK